MGIIRVGSLEVKRETDQISPSPFALTQIFPALIKTQILQFPVHPMLFFFKILNYYTYKSIENIHAHIKKKNVPTAQFNKVLSLRSPLHAPCITSLSPALQEEPHLEIIKTISLFYFQLCHICMYHQAYCIFPSFLFFFVCFFILLHDLRFIPDGVRGCIQMFLLLYAFHCMNIQVTYLFNYGWAFGLLLLYFLCYCSDAMNLLGHVSCCMREMAFLGYRPRSEDVRS